MQVTFAISMQEANTILSEHFANRHNLMFSDIKVVIDEVDNVQSIQQVNINQQVNIKMRRDLITLIKLLLPNKKITAIKEFRQINQDADLRQAKYFVETPSIWEHYINTGDYT